MKRRRKGETATFQPTEENLKFLLALKKRGEKTTILNRALTAYRASANSLKP